MGLLDRGPAACRRDSSCEVLEPIRASRPEDHGCAAVREQEGRRGADTTARAIVTSDAEFTLHAVARQTGVGQGTLYRNFLAHEDLLAEVYRRKVDELVEAAERLLIVHEPGETLAQWLDGVMQYATVKRGVLAAVEASLWC